MGGHEQPGRRCASDTSRHGPRRHGREGHAPGGGGRRRRWAVLAGWLVRTPSLATYATRRYVWCSPPSTGTARTLPLVFGGSTRTSVPSGMRCCHDLVWPPGVEVGDVLAQHAPQVAVLATDTIRTRPVALACLECQKLTPDSVCSQHRRAGASPRPSDGPVACVAVGNGADARAPRAAGRRGQKDGGGSSWPGDMDANLACRLRRR